MVVLLHKGMVDGRKVMVEDMDLSEFKGCKIDFTTITACGECCVKCSKKIAGECPGCIETDGVVPEWKESGRCKIHTCVRKNGVQFCGLCKNFPCDNLQKLIPWNSNIVEHLTYLRDEYERQV